MEPSALVPPAPDPNDLFDDIFYNFSPVTSNLSARSVHYNGLRGHFFYCLGSISRYVLLGQKQPTTSGETILMEV